MTQTHVTEIQETLPTTSVLLNKESPSQRVGHLRTSAHLPTKQEENVQPHPHQCSLVPRAYLLWSLPGG